MTHDFLPAFHPNADALLARISSHIDDGMLAEMAAADRERDVPEHLGALRLIRDSGVVPAPLPWEPREVLELTRWSDPDNPDWFPGAARMRAHWMRAFACAALLRALILPQGAYGLEGQNQTLIQLIGSLAHLDAGLDAEAAAMVAQIIVHLGPQDEESAFYGVGLLWFALRLSPPIADDVIVALAQWTSAREQARNAGWHGQYGLKPGRWLLSTTSFDQRHAAWEALGAELAVFDLAGRATEARDWVHLIGRQLATA